MLRHAEGKSEAQAKDIIKAWLKSGTLFNERYEDKAARKELDGLRVNATIRPD